MKKKKTGYETLCLILLIILALVFLGIYLVVHAFQRIQGQDRTIRKLKDRYPVFAEFEA